MKKLFLTMLGVVLIAAPTVIKAQDEVVGIYIQKVNADKLKASVAKSDAEIADPKKAAKSATWIKRGNMFIDVDGRPTNGLYPATAEMAIDEANLKVSIPTESEVTNETLGGASYTVYNSGQAKIYVRDGFVMFYTSAIVVDSMALNKAYDAFDQAYKMDPKAAKKIKAGMQKIQNKSKLDAEIYSMMDNMRMAAANYRMAYKASAHPTVAVPDSAALYSAGDASYSLGDYAAAIEDLDTLIEMGYYNEGNVFLVKAASEYQLGRTDEALKTMSTGMDLFPGNEGLINLAMFFYTDQDKDPTELVPTVLAAIEKNPENARLYDGLARIYNALGNYDKAIETVRKSIELTPNDWIPYYLESNYISAKVSEMNNEAASKSMSLSHAENQAAKAAIDDVLKTAVTALEKAHELAPTRTEVVARLKELTFLLREYPEFAAKNEKYSKLFEEM